MLLKPKGAINKKIIRMLIKQKLKNGINLNLRTPPSRRPRLAGGACGFPERPSKAGSAPVRPAGLGDDEDDRRDEQRAGRLTGLVATAGAIGATKRPAKANVCVCPDKA